MLSFLTFVALLAAPPTVSVDPPLALGPKPKWVVFYADNYCVLIRPRSGLAGGLRIESRPFEAEHELHFLLPKDGRGNYLKPGRLSVGSSLPAAANYISVDELPYSADRRVKAAISKKQLALAASDRSLGVTIQDRIDERVSTAGLGKALLAVKTCEEDLASRWGTPKNWSIDPVPNVDPVTVFRSADYPTSLLNANVQGDARLLIKIGASGEALTCQSINRNELKQFADVVCAIFRNRVRFTPAMNAVGSPVESYYVTPRVRFQF